MSKPPAKPFTTEADTEMGGNVATLDERIAPVAEAIVRCREATESAGKRILAEALEPRISGAFPLQIIRLANPERYNEISSDILGACHVMAQYYIKETAYDDTRIAGMLLSLITNEASKYIKPLLSNVPPEQGEFKIRLEFSDTTDLNSINLHISFTSLLEQELRSNGWSEADAANVAHSATASLDLTPLTSPEQIKAAVRLAAETAQAARNSASGAFERATKLPLPTETPAKWVDRDPKQFPTAESFLRHHFGPRLGMEGDLTLAEIGRYDTPLLTALNREFKGRRHELHVLLPTVTDRANQRLLKKYGYVPQGGDRKSKLAMMSLQRKPNP